MYTYIVMLRGINVSGQKIIKMQELRSILADARLHNVQTYIQSGNIIFEGEKDSIYYESLIKEKIQDHYGFEVPTIVKRPTDFEYLLNNNPFLAGNDINRLAVTFLSNAPKHELIDQFKAIEFSTEESHIHKDIIFIHLPEGFATSKLTNNLMEQKLKVQATTRNWKTVNKLYEMASATE